MTGEQRAGLAGQKQTDDSNIDNGATYTQVIFLARVYTARKLERHREAFQKGVDYLLKAQYENGGWPQYYPRLTGYYKHITFNDNAMINVMRLLRDISAKKPDYLFVDEVRGARAGRAVERGVECILKAQVVVRGRRTVWGAQHDEVTRAPAAARRRYEPPSLSAPESVSIVRFMMGIKSQDARQPHRTGTRRRFGGPNCKRQLGIILRGLKVKIFAHKALNIVTMIAVEPWPREL